MICKLFGQGSLHSQGANNDDYSGPWREVFHPLQISMLVVYHD